MEFAQRTASLLVVMLLLGSCLDEQATSLIRSYENDWDVNISSRYARLDLFPPVVPEFTATHINQDSSIILVGSILNESGLRDIIVTLLSPRGIFIKDMIIASEYPGYFSADTYGNFIMVSYTQNSVNRTFRIFDSGLNVIDTGPIDWPNSHLYSYITAIDKTSYYVKVYDGSLTNLYKYDFDGTFKWSVSLDAPELCGSDYIRHFFKPSGELFFMKYNPDTIRLAEINQANGSTMWIRDFMTNKVLEDGWISGAAVDQGGGLFMLGSSQDEIYLARFAANGFLLYSREVNIEEDINQAGAIYPTRDGGLLLSMNGYNSLTNFQLVKLDSRGNPGWIGNFYQAGNGVLSSVKEGRDGSLVLLTSDGTLYKLKPGF